MTTIAWDGSMMAADKRTTFGATVATTRKLHLIDGALVGAAGTSAEIAEVREWIRNGAKPEDFPPSQREGDTCVSTLVVTSQGAIRQYEHTPYPICIEDKQWAIGSGSAYALAAMACGKTAYEAVEIACRFDSNSGNGIDWMFLPEAAQEANELLHESALG